MNKDLTVGNPKKVLWQFCLPLFASVVFQQLYNIADSLVAGKFVGENALAAVGNSYEITLIFIAFAFGCNIGCSVIVAQLFGEKNIRDMKTAVYTTFLATGLLCAGLMAFGLLCGGQMLEWIRTPEGILGDSKLYLDIYVLGLPFLFYYNISTGIFSAMGDSKTPFYFLAFSSTANIGVDILFTRQLQMGVAGVAWATFLCQGVSCVLAVLVVLKRLRSVGVEGQKAAIFSMEIFKKIAVIAVPSILQQSFISVGNIIIQGVINGFGEEVIAGYAAAIKLNNLVITSFTTLGNGISNFTAQNIGAKLHARIREGFRAGVGMVWSICVPVVILYFALCRNLVAFFIDAPSEGALQTGVDILRILAPFYFVVSLKLISDGVLRGSGLMKEFMIGTFADLILRVVLAYVFAGQFGAIGIWCAWPIGWSVAMVISVVFYRKSTKEAAD